MRAQTIIFYLVFFLTHVLFNSYIYLRGREALAGYRAARRIFTIIFLFLFLSSALDMFLYRLPASPLFMPVHWAGSFWYGAMLYFFMATLLVDGARLGMHIVGAKPRIIYGNYARARLIIFLGTVSLVTGLMVYGFLHARDLSVTTVRLTVHKNAGTLKELKIAMISDIHINRMIGARRMGQVVDRINTLNPDLVLMPGDIVDSVVEPFVEDGVSAVIARLKPRFGIYACTGNHEFYGDIEKTIPILEQSGIRFLRDRAELVAGAFYLAGREDRTARSYYGAASRVPLTQLIAKVDARCPVILMDHNPASLAEASLHGIDLQVSGHTHHGQIFPFMYITDLIYECSFGYAMRGSTHYYVSSGVGSWGPPVRIGTDAEIVNIILSFE